MNEREMIVALLDGAYAARQRENVDAADACFTDDGSFRVADGEPAVGRTARRAALERTFAAVDLLDMRIERCLIDPPHASVHWRGTFRLSGGTTAEFAIFDLIEVRDGRIASLATCYDTARAERLMAGSS